LSDITSRPEVGHRYIGRQSYNQEREYEIAWLCCALVDGGRVVPVEGVPMKEMKYEDDVGMYCWYGSEQWAEVCVIDDDY
jgi:hypothetical protein